MRRKIKGNTIACFVAIFFCRIPSSRDVMSVVRCDEYEMKLVDGECQTQLNTCLVDGGVLLKYQKAKGQMRGMYPSVPGL